MGQKSHVRRFHSFVIRALFLGPTIYSSTFRIMTDRANSKRSRDNTYVDPQALREAQQREIAAARQMQQEKVMALHHQMGLARATSGSAGMQMAEGRTSSGFETHGKLLSER